MEKKSGGAKNEKEKKKPELARHYGLDISMSESAIGSSVAMQREYRMKCKRIYKDFLKNMNSHMKEEKEIKKTLCQLNREKINNRQYSLYRSTGNDLFSTAKQIRKKLMESKLITVSPLLEEFHGDTPWGLDAIPDEDLIRPQTAPSTAVEHHFEPPQLSPGYQQRPMTVAKGNSYDLIEHHPQQIQHSNDEFSFYRRKSIDRGEAIRIPTGSKTDKVRFQSPAIEPPKIQSPVPEKSEESEEEEVKADGEVDVNTERTRARKIIIDPMVFARLSKGTVNVTLKNKTGKFIVKPITINYTVSDVDAVFMPKDPAKEKMALVREKTSIGSATVAADMKINNKLAILKSLVGKDTKKTTVAEIMENSRYRKTRHFKIVKKLSPEEEKRRDSSVQNCASKWKTRALAPAATGMTHIVQNKQKNGNVKSNGSNRATLTVEAAYQSDVPDPRYVSPKLLAARERRMSISSIHRPTSQCTDNSHDGLNHSQTKVPFKGMLHEGIDRSQTPLNRAPSAMSQRDGRGDGIPFSGNDKHITDLIRRLVEGGKDETDTASNRPESSLDNSHWKSVRMKLPKRAYTPSSHSDQRSEVSLSFDVPNKLDSVEATKRIVKDLMKKDMEYEEDMNNMKRRMMSGRTTPFGRRRPSIIA